MMKKKTCFFILLALLGCSLSAQTTIGVDGDFRSIGEAIDSMSHGSIELELLDPVYTEAAIVITGNVVITGRGKNSTVIQAAEIRGEAFDRVFTVTKTGSLELNNLTVRHGNRIDLPLRGGGIDNEGKLRMVNCALSDNDAVYGAGLFTRGKAELIGCEINGNSTRKAPLEISISGIGCVGSGGGIKTEKGGELLLENCAVYDNYSIKRGGGLFVACESRADIINSTFTENSCAQRGGGICSKGDVFLIHVTIARNDSVQRGSGFTNMGKASLYATLLADNSYDDFANIEAGGIYGGGFVEQNTANFTSDGSLEGAASGNARIKQLEKDGQDIPFIPIGWFSPARNAADYHESPETDQRGVLRDFKPDIGAFENRPIPWRH